MPARHGEPGARTTDVAPASLFHSKLGMITHGRVDFDLGVHGEAGVRRAEVAPVSQGVGSPKCGFFSVDACKHKLPTATRL